MNDLIEDININSDPDFKYPRTHECKFFLFQIKTDFEPIIVDGKVTYTKGDFGFSGCNCGRVIKAEALRKSSGQVL